MGEVVAFKPKNYREPEVPEADIEAARERMRIRRERKFVNAAFPLFLALLAVLLVTGWGYAWFFSH